MAGCFPSRYLFQPGQVLVIPPIGGVFKPPWLKAPIRKFCNYVPPRPTPSPPYRCSHTRRNHTRSDARAIARIACKVHAQRVGMRKVGMLRRHLRQSRRWSGSSAAVLPRIADAVGTRRRHVPSASGGGHSCASGLPPVQIYNPSFLDIDARSREPIGWRALGNMRAAVRPDLGLAGSA